MSIINVNAFQNGINKKDYLTSYTDAYLKQSLANLGQRIGAKGDSIAFDNFTVQDLFPNYTGNFSEDRLLTEFKYYPSEGKVVGALKTLEDDGNVKSLAQDEASSRVTISHIDGLLNGISTEIDDENIKISDVTTINNVDYWHKENAVMYKTSSSLIYKVVGHHEGGAYGDYDNEYVCEEVGDDGKLVEGFRIFIANEQNLLGNPVVRPTESMLPNDDSAHEILVLIHLRRKKESERTNRAFGDVDWALDVYKFSKANSQWLDLGDVADAFGESNNIDLLIKDYDSSNANKPGTIVANLLDGIIEEDRAGIITYLYTLPIQEGASKNVAWSVPDSYLMKWRDLGDSVSFSGKGVGYLKPDVATTSNDSGILADIDLLQGESLSSTNGKIEYFANDVASLYPRLLELYNEVMYKSSSNLKIKEQIVGQLVYKAWNDAMSVEGTTDSDRENVYVMYMPVNYAFKYTYNSSDKSIIYNMSSSIPVTFDNLANVDGTTVTAATDSFGLLDKIAWNTDRATSDENYSPDQTILGNSPVQNTILYDLIITYNDDLILLNMTWFTSFIMPYIDATGFWVINGVKTSNYAKGIVGEQGNVIITMSSDLTKFSPEEGILSGAGIDELKAFSSKSFELKEFKTDYVSNSEVTSARDPYTMYAYLPSDEAVTQLVNTETFSYLSGALIMSMSSMALEKDAFVTTYANWKNGTGRTGHVIGNYDLVKDAYDTDKYDKVNYTDWKLYEDSSYSYIYRYTTKTNSLNNELGSNGVVMSFWTCKKQETENSTYYGFDYIRKPGTDIALDFSYMTNLEQYVKHYAKVVFSPDDYEHTQLVFDAINLKLKNNTSDNADTIWPTILNRNADYYSPIGDTSKDLGQSSEVASQQYMNSANLVVEFNDTITRVNGSIESVSNSDRRRFKIDTYQYTYLEPYTYLGARKDKDGNYVVEEVAGRKEKQISYGVIPNLINYTYFPKEYIPNSKYDPNTDSYSYQYPSLDIKEVLVRNANVENRVNVIGFQPAREGDLTSYGILYNAYIGTTFEDEDKSVLHIGTSSTNPNLGTTTMVDDESASSLTKMRKIAVDFDEIDLNGYTTVKGEIMTDRPTWTVHNVGNYNTYVATFYPNGKVYNKMTNPDKLLVKTTYQSAQRHNTRYFRNADKNLTISYLNVTKMLEDAYIPVDTNTIINGDARLLSLTTTEYNTQDQRNAASLVELENEHPGWLQVKMADAEKGIFRKNQAWSSYYPTNDEDWNGARRFLKKEVTFEYSSSGNGKTMMTETTYERNNDGSVKKDANGQPIVSTVKYKKSLQFVTSLEGSLSPTEKTWYLELSADLTNPENRIGYGPDENGTYIDIMQSNPIEVSYTDVISYQMSYNVPTYTYVPTYLYYPSYTESWYCDGCDLCSAASCTMIRKCNKSSCRGYWTPAYFSPSMDEIKNGFNDPGDIAPYVHDRWYKADTGEYVKYETYSYAQTKYKTARDFATKAEFDVLLVKDDKIFTYYPSPVIPGFSEYRWMQDTPDNRSYLATRIPYSSYIQSAYIMDYIASYMTDQKYAIKEHKYIYTYEGSFSSSILDNPSNAVQNKYAYVKLASTNLQDGTHYRMEEGESPILSQFSHYVWTDNQKLYDQTIRNVNVREILTSHSRPEFFNELLTSDLVAKVNNTDVDAVPAPTMPIL